MDEPRTVYVVVAGEYSDFHIVGVFATREVAEASAERGRAPDEGPDDYGAAHVVEYPLDEVAYEPAWRGRASVAVARNTPGTEPVDARWPTVGGFLEHGQWVYVPLAQPEVTVHEPTQWYDLASPVRDAVELSWQYPRKGEPPFEVWVWVKSTSTERAKKVAAERAYRLAAEWDVEVEAARDRGDWS